MAQPLYCEGGGSSGCFERAGGDSWGPQLFLVVMEAFVSLCSVLFCKVLFPFFVEHSDTVHGDRRCKVTEKNPL